MQAHPALETCACRPGPRGFTLTEIAIVLGVMGLILGAIWVAASTVYTNMRVTATTRDIISMSQGIRKLYANQGVMDNISTQNLISTGVVPNDMVSGATLTDNWAGTVTFTPAVTINTAGDSFIIDLSNVPMFACVGLLNDSSARTPSSGLYGLGAGANAFTTIADFGNPPTIIYTPTEAVGLTVCGSSPTANHVGYAFSIH